MMNKVKSVLLVASLVYTGFANADLDGNSLYKGYKDYVREYTTQDAFAYMGFVRGVAAMLIVDKKYAQTIIFNSHRHSIRREIITNHIQNHVP